MAQLEKEQGNLSVYHDKQAKATSAIAGLEVDLANAQDALVAKEHSRQDAMADKKLLEQECLAVKKDIEDVDMAIQKIEQEKTQLSQDKETCRQKLDRGIKLIGN